MTLGEHFEAVSTWLPIAGFLLALWGAGLSTILAVMRVRERRESYLPIVELLHRRTIGGGAYVFSLVVKNPSNHALRVENVRLLSHKLGKVSYTESPQPIDDPTQFNEPLPTLEVEAKTNRQTFALVTVPGSPELPVRIELAVELRVRSRTLSSKRRRVKVAALAVGSK